MTPDPHHLTGVEAIYAPGLDLHDASVLAFWRWAFGDLRANDLRGIFAEWLVARLLSLPLTARRSWDGWDLQTPAGITIEVKTSAYHQIWPQRAPSKIVFAGLRTRLWDEITGLFAETATYKADLYVFCVQIEQDADNWKALDLNQWRFYLLPRKVLAATNRDSIGLASLQSLTGTLGWTAAEFQQHATTALATTVHAASVPPADGVS